MKQSQKALSMLIIMMVLSSAHPLKAQISTANLQKEDLLKLSYEALKGMEDEAFDQDSIKTLRLLTKTHILKAKQDKNTLEMARGYYYHTFIEAFPLTLVYADSICSVTKNSDHHYYPTQGYISKGRIHYESGAYQKALDSYLIAYNIALKKKNLDDQRFISVAIAAIRNINGQPYAAADLYNRALKLLQQEPDYETVHYEDYTTLIYNLSLVHLRLKQLDSARYYVNKGIGNALKQHDSLEYRYFITVEAQINYYKKDFIKARDTLVKYMDAFDGTAKANKLYYIAKTNQELGSYDKAVSYYKKIDSIVDATGEPIDNIKEVYFQLTLYAKHEDDVESQIIYIEKLMHYDSILSSNQQGIAHTVTVAYDIPALKFQKQQAEARLKQKEYWMLGLGSISLLTIIFGMVFYIREKRAKAKVKHFFDHPKNSVKPTIPIIKEHLDSVPEDIRERILKQLVKFETAEQYLDKDIDIPVLAHGFDTNTTYLSNIINHYKGKSFPNYIKDLRIDYAIGKLASDVELLKYNYQGLADLFGFKTPESFSRAFFKRTGVYPSQFLKELKNRKDHHHL